MELNKTAADLNKVADICHEMLLKNVSGSLDYVKKRGFSEYSIHKWKIGFIPEGLKDFEFFWWNRVCFPIWENKSDRVIGFSARKITVDDRSKYVNSENDEIYNKSVSLYGLNFVPEGADAVYLCEGCPDVVTLNQEKGVYSIASLGWGFTPAQATEIKKRGVKNVIICYDNDEAGTKGIVAAIPILRRAGIPYKSIGVIRIHDAKDVDEALQKKCNLSIISAQKFYREAGMHDRYVDLLVGKKGDTDNV